MAESSTKRQLIIVGAGLLVLVAGFGVMRLLASQKEPPKRKDSEQIVRSVKVQEVVNDTLPSEIAITGKIEARQKIEIYSEVSGVLKSTAKPFKVGSAFKQGQVLLAIDADENRLSLYAQKSQFKSAVLGALVDVKIDYPKSYVQLQSFSQQIKVEEPLPQFPEITDTQLENYLSGQGIYNSYYTLKSAEERLSKFTVVAPFSGVISLGSINPGTLVRSGQKIGEFINPESYELRAAISRDELALINIGDAVALKDEGGNKYMAEVLRLSKVVDPTTQTLSVFVKLQAENLSDGMFLDGTIYGKSLSNVFPISRNLIYNRDKIYIVNDSILGVAEIKTVLQLPQQVYVQGLADGDLIINQKISEAYSGMRVKY